MRKINMETIIGGIITIIAYISLFFTFTNYIMVSAIICSTIIFFPYLFLKKKDKNTISKILFFTFAYFTVCVILYNFQSLFQIGFYRRDGNFFISFAPILILSVVTFKSRIYKIVDGFIIISTIFNVISIITFFIFRESYEYFFMFFTHNAAGGFITTLICFSFAKWKESKSKLFLIITILNLASLILTQSRGSIIGLIFAILCFISVFKTKFRNADKVLFMCCFIGIITISTITLCMNDFNVLNDNGLNFSIPDNFLNTKLSFMLEKIGRSHTIVNRTFYLWPRALKVFTISPIFGTGYGSFNDIPYMFNTVIDNVLVINNSNTIIYSDSHAHNSYLHILAETGICGITVIIILLLNLRKEILKINNIYLKYALYTSFMCIIFSSFTEHRLFTPSQVFPFTIVFGLYLAEKNYYKLNKEKEVIIINGRFLTQKITGVQRYAIEIVKQLDKITKKDIILVCPNTKIVNSLKLKNIKIVKYGKVEGHFWEQIILPTYLLKFWNYNAKLLNLCNVAPIICPGYITLHDISFKTQSRHLSKKFTLCYKIITFMNIKRYNKIFTPSEFSKNEIIDNYKINPKKIIISYNSAEHMKKIKGDENILKKLNLESDGYYFSLGSKSYHKNHKFVLKCAKDNPKEKFVISGNNNSNVFKTQNDEKIDNVVYTGYLSDEQLVSLYAQCKAFIFPSLYEGFGIPPLEAITVGCKNIILSDIPALKEIYKESANYIDVSTNEKININQYKYVKNIQKILSEYSWENSAKIIYNNL